MTEFVRFTDRLAGVEPEEELYEGVPDHLDAALRRWLVSEIARNSKIHRKIGMRLRLSGYDPATRADGMIARLNDDQLLNAIDVALQFDDQRYEVSLHDGSTQPGVLHAIALQEMLRESGSAYQAEVFGDEDMLRLVRKVDETAREAYEAAQTAADAVGRKHASARLQEAWHAVYGRHPDPGLAYSKAIKAVEAAAIPVISPNNAKATFGTVTAALRDQAAKWSFAVNHQEGANPVDLVVSMMNGFWTGQTDRHEGNTPAAPITQEAAEVAVHLAVTLVHWFSTGKVAKTS